jgi:hypothetical protein
MSNHHYSNLTTAQMEKLSTQRLLAYKKKLWEHVPYYHEDWVATCKCEDCVAERKEIEKHEALIDAVKKVLAKREHVEKLFGIGKHYLKLTNRQKLREGDEGGSPVLYRNIKDITWRKVPPEYFGRTVKSLDHYTFRRPTK